MSIVNLDESENLLLERKEITAVLKNQNGIISRRNAAKLIAEKLSVNDNLVYTVSLINSSGSNETVGTFYVYSSEDDAKSINKIIKRRNFPEEAKPAKEAKPAEEAKD